MIGTNPKLLYNMCKFLLLAAKCGCICTPLTPLNPPLIIVEVNSSVIAPSAHTFESLVETPHF